ncbi:hypothetical protein NW761_013731 [Fusarium oxysporum]|nr:hypothetical protein NW758_013466 [Fusarium oxysporum]KAJ4074515.1 hypothetical protein NW761_013731 [Fusarium oxysporum]
MTGTRRPYFKSRSGCQNCKRRKIKCGEETPSCRNCARRGKVCSFLGSSASLAANPSSALPHAQLPSSSETALPIPRPPGTGDDGFGPAGLTILDMELLHHYSISTALTLSSDPTLGSYFLQGVPQLGFSHTYVLHSILALASSHVAHLRPESRQYYYDHSRARHTAATSMATPLLSDISAANAIPLFCFSFTTVFIAFGSLRDEDHLPFQASSLIPNWLVLFRGLRTILEANNGALFSSPVSFLFQTTEVKRSWEFKQADMRALLEFQGFIKTSTSEEDEQTRQLLLDAFQELRRALYFFYDGNFGNEVKNRSLFTWMYKISDGFLSLVQQGNRKALCILGFACVLVHQLEYNWWCQGWGIRWIERVYASLDSVHRFWIAWPIKEIGWVPKRETADSKNI